MSDTVIVNLVALAFSALLGFIPATVASRKGRSFWGYWWLSFLLGPIGFVGGLLYAICIKRPQPQLEGVSL